MNCFHFFMKDQIVLCSNDPYLSNRYYMQDVVMKFKVHKVKQLYSDLQKYGDSRDELSQFSIGAPAISIEYAELLGALNHHGYRTHSCTTSVLFLGVSHQQDYLR